MARILIRPAVTLGIAASLLSAPSAIAQHGSMAQNRGTIAIDLGDKQYRWPIGRTNMMNVIVAVENCTHKALGH